MIGRSLIDPPGQRSIVSPILNIGIFRIRLRIIWEKIEKEG